jgi:uncharacterized integral membrane protein (TIGR00698 family)
MARSSTSQCGTRCSEIVWLAAMASRCDTPDRIERSPASSRSAASSTSSAQPTTSRPCSVRCDPDGVRASSVTPVARSSVRIRADSACCETPSTEAAAAIEPCLPTSRSARSAPRSCTVSAIGYKGNLYPYKGRRLPAGHRGSEAGSAMNAVTHPRRVVAHPLRPIRPAASPSVTLTVGRRARGVAPGLALAVAVAAVATVIGQCVPLVGSAVPGAVIGAVIALVIKPGARLAAGVKFSSTFLLQCSVVLLGTQLSIGEAARVGVSSLPVMLGTLAVCLSAAWLYGRLLGIPRDLRTLIGVGTGICGGSAIAAVSPVIEAASTDVAYAISTIFLFNIAAVLAFPLIGHAIGMSQQSFGLFAGTAVNDTSSVVATATTYGAAAANHAIVVKLVRTLMIIPICLGLAGLTARRKRAEEATGAAAAAPSPGPAPSPPLPTPRSSTCRPSSSPSPSPPSACPPTCPRCARPARGRCCSARCSGSRSRRPASASSS